MADSGAGSDGEEPEHAPLLDGINVFGLGWHTTDIFDNALRHLQKYLHAWG